jgi:hypothetical protein
MVLAATIMAAMVVQLVVLETGAMEQVLCCTVV